MNSTIQSSQSMPSGHPYKHSGPRQVRVRVSELPCKYRQALREYLSNGSEASLHEAYRLGRESLASDTGLLGLVTLHYSATSELLDKTPAEAAQKLRAAGRFLLESLSPFEMMQLGNQESNAALRRMNELLEDDARRIAHALHDQTDQLLASAYLELAEIRRDAQSPAVCEHVEKLSAQFDLIHEQLRRLSHELRPPLLDHLGLLPALEFLAAGFHKRTGLDINIENPTADVGRFPQAIEIALYRVVQEALNNITRHAQARHAEIRIWTEDDSVHCDIGDDGIGFTPPSRSAESAPIGGLGLLGIRERIGSLHGDLRISSAPGSGTKLRIFVPLRVDS